MNIIIRMPVVQEISPFFPVVFLQFFILIVTSEVTGLFPSGYKPIPIPLRMLKNNIQQPHIDLFHSTVVLIEGDSRLGFLQRGFTQDRKCFSNFHKGKTFQNGNYFPPPPQKKKNTP